MATPVVRSQVVSIGELLRSGVFAPARVQRAYCWTEEQQQALLEDLLAAFAEFGLDPEPTAEVQPPAGWQVEFTGLRHPCALRCRTTKLSSRGGSRAVEL